MTVAIEFDFDRHFLSEESTSFLGRAEQRNEMLRNGVNRYLPGCTSQSIDQFDLAVGEFLADVDPIRNANQLCILELNARALVAVIQQYIDSRADPTSLASSSPASRSSASRTLVTVTTTSYGAMTAGKVYCSTAGLGREFCSTGFDCGGEDALDADPVAAHDGPYFFAVRIEDARSHAVAVLVSELEDVTDLYCFTEAKWLTIRRDQFACVYVADVGDQGR